MDKEKKEDIRPTAKDLPILDVYIKNVLACEKRPNKVTADELNLSASIVSGSLNRNKEYTRQKIQEVLKEADITKVMVLQELKNLAFSNISDYGDFDGEGMAFESWSKLDRQTKACIKDIKITHDKQGNKNVHFTLYDKHSALRDLAKIYELSSEIVTVKGEVSIVKRLFDAD